MSSSSSTCETKTSSNNTNAVVVFTDLLGIVNHGYSLTWCKSIFAYLGPTAKETLSLRSYCKLFSKALKPLPCWTSFPHPKYSTLNGLFDRFTELSSSDRLSSSDSITRYGNKYGRNNLLLTNIPEVLLIDNGVHDENGCSVDINIPISIIGESREHCIIIGGLRMNGKKKDDVYVSNLTLRDSYNCGVSRDCGASIHLDNVSVENSRWHGVEVFGGRRHTMKNCNVSHSKRCGIVVGSRSRKHFDKDVDKTHEYTHTNGLMKIDGNATTIHHNCTSGGRVFNRTIIQSYGLCTHDSSSSIHLASSLTIEAITKNNGGGENNGGPGTIKTNCNWTLLPGTHYKQHQRSKKS